MDEQHWIRCESSILYCSLKVLSPTCGEAGKDIGSFSFCNPARFKFCSEEVPCIISSSCFAKFLRTISRLFLSSFSLSRNTGGNSLSRHGLMFTDWDRLTVELFWPVTVKPEFSRESSFSRLMQARLKSTSHKSGYDLYHSWNVFNRMMNNRWNTEIMKMTTSTPLSSKKVG